MRIVSTSDVPLQDLEEFAGQLRPGLDAEVDTRQVSFRSVDPPSFVTFLAEAPWWVQALAMYAGLYVTELVKEAAKETWRQRGKALVVPKVAGDQLRRLAGAIAALRTRLSDKTTIGVGLPQPSEFFPTRLALEGEDPELVAVQLALFIHHLPALSEFISMHGLAESGKVATGVFLNLQDDGSLLISWHDSDTLQVREYTLKLRDGV
jgi:hypothetical protein